MHILIQCNVSNCLFLYGEQMVDLHVGGISFVDIENIAVNMKLNCAWQWTDYFLHFEIILRKIWYVNVYNNITTKNILYR